MEDVRIIFLGTCEFILLMSKAAFSKIEVNGSAVLRFTLLTIDKMSLYVSTIPITTRKTNLFITFHAILVVIRDLSRRCVTLYSFHRDRLQIILAKSTAPTNFSIFSQNYIMQSEVRNLSIL